MYNAHEHVCFCDLQVIAIGHRNREAVVHLPNVTTREEGNSNPCSF